MNRSQIVIGCSLAAAALLFVFVGAGVLAWMFVRPMMRMASHEMPARLATPAVLVGSGTLSKTVWLSDPMLGSVTDIQFGHFDSPTEKVVGIAGTGGAVFADDAGMVRSTVRFTTRTTSVNIIDVEGDGVCEFLDRGGRGWQDAALLDHSGKVLWSCGNASTGSAVDDTAAGDLDGDGVLDFVVGFNGGGGVRLFDEKGVQKWQQPDGNVWHVEICDTDGDGKPEIIHSNAGGQISIRDRSGSIIKSTPAPEYLSAFSLCPWPGKADPQFILYATGDAVLVVGFDGTTKARLTAPDCDRFGHASGAPVKLRPGEPESLAVVIHYDNWNRSVLYVYDPAGKLVYQEVLAEPCSAIAARPIAGSEGEAILLGGLNQVWEYRLAP